MFLRKNIKKNRRIYWIRFNVHTKCGHHCLRQMIGKFSCRHHFSKEFVENSRLKKKMEVWHFIRGEMMKNPNNTTRMWLWFGGTIQISTSILSTHAVIALYNMYQKKTSKDFKDVVNMFVKNLQKSGQFTLAISKFDMNSRIELWLHRTTGKSFVDELSISSFIGENFYLSIQRR